MMVPHSKQRRHTSFALLQTITTDRQSSPDPGHALVQPIGTSGRFPSGGRTTRWSQRTALERMGVSVIWTLICKAVPVSAERHCAMGSYIVLSVCRHDGCSDSGLSSRPGYFRDLQVGYWTQICLSSDFRVLAHGHFNQICLMRRGEKWLHWDVHRRPVRDE